MEEWRSSGESLAGFGRRWSLDPCRISRWARRLEESAAPESVAFHPVRVVGPAADPASVRWVAEVCRREWTVRVPSGFSAPDVARLFDVVAEVERC